MNKYLIAIIILVIVITIFIVLFSLNSKIPKPLCDTKDLEECSLCSLNCINKNNDKKVQ